MTTFATSHNTPASVEEAFSKSVTSRLLTRTPSPTPSEAAALTAIDDTRPFSFKTWLKENWIKHLIIALIITLVTVLSHFNSQIVHALKPESVWLKKTPGAWLIPIAIMIPLSFPPLIGNDILLVFIGFVWGIGAGFGIAAAGTIIGEVIVFYIFKFMCGRRKRTSEPKIRYSALARVVRDGGFKTAIIARYSAIPSHLTTALFAACGMDFWTFLFAALLSLPKQIASVYIGFALSEAGSAHAKTSNTVQWIITAVTVIVTIIAMRYIRKKQAAVTPEIIYERRKHRQAELVAPTLSISSSPSLLEEGRAYPAKGLRLHTPMPVRVEPSFTGVLAR